MESSQTRNWTHVPCIGRQILNHWTTRGMPPALFKSLNYNILVFERCFYIICSKGPSHFHITLLTSRKTSSLKISGSREIKAFLEEQWKTKLIKIQASLVLVLTKPLRRRKANHFILLCLVLVTQSCPTLHYRMDYSPPGSSVHGILQARVLEWIVVSFSRGSSWFRNWTQVSYIIGGCFTVWATREAPIFTHMENQKKKEEEQ